MEKRGDGQQIEVSLADIDAPAKAISEDLIAVNEALDELEKLDSRCAQGTVSNMGQHHPNR